MVVYAVTNLKPNNPDANLTNVAWLQVVTIPVAGENRQEYTSGLRQVYFQS